MSIFPDVYIEENEKIELMRVVARLKGYRYDFYEYMRSFTIYKGNLVFDDKVEIYYNEIGMLNVVYKLSGRHIVSGDRKKMLNMLDGVIEWLAR